MKESVFIIYLVVFYSTTTFSQMGTTVRDGIEIARFEYSMVPSLGEVELNRTSLALNFGTKLKTGFFGFGLGYENNALYFEDSEENILYDDFSNLHTVRMNFMYRRPLKDQWSLNMVFAPMLSSNFNNTISNEDFVFNSFTSFSKRWFKNELTSTLNIGIGFGTLFGRPRLFPLISYFKEVNDKFSFSLGLPRTGIIYRFNSYNRIEINAMPEGIFANNASELSVSENVSIRNSKIQYNALRLSFGYRLKFDDNWSSLFSLGYIPVSSMTVLDDNNNDINDFETDSSIFINVGLSFNINKKRKKDD